MPLPTIPSGNVASATAGGFEVANSCRFDRSANAKLTRTLGTPTDRDKWTWSAWVKLAKGNQEQGLFFGYIDANNYAHIEVSSTGQFKFYNHLSGSANAAMRTVGLLRDSAAWYHLVLIWDSGNATEANRLKMYINGVHQIGSLITSVTYPSQDDNSSINGNNLHEVGAKLGSYGFDGYMSEVCFVDGQALAPTEFGEYDEDSPTIWKPKRVSGLTFGDNGAFFDFKDSANLGNDAQGGTDWSESNIAATDQMIDTPTNNFPVINVLNNMASTQMVITEGNLHKSTQTSNYWDSVYGTMGVSSGKWYYEMKITNVNSGDTGNMFIGIVDVDQMDNATSGHYKFVNQSRGYGYFGQNGNKDNNSSSSSFGGTWGAVDDIVGCAFDLDNLKIYFSKDGTWQNSGDPTSGATGTGSAYDLASGYTYLPAIGVHYGDDHFDLNFGSPINTISSGNADANGYGNFEYAVPSGYYALCTKNLAEYG
jgi:hypothetical protein